MWHNVMFALVICQVLLTWVPFEFVHFLCNFISYPKNLTSMDCNHCLFIVLFTIPTAVALLQCTGICGCGCPISANVSRKLIPVWQLWYNALSSAFAVEATTNHIIVVLTWNVPFNCMGSPFWGIHPMKKMSTCPAPCFCLWQVKRVRMNV